MNTENESKNIRITDCFYATAILGVLLTINYGLISQYSISPFITIINNIIFLLIWSIFMIKRFNSYKKMIDNEQRTKFENILHIIDNYNTETKHINENKINELQNYMQKKFNDTESMTKTLENSLTLKLNDFINSQEKINTENITAVLSKIDKSKEDIQNWLQNNIVILIEKQLDNQEILLTRLDENNNLINNNKEAFILAIDNKANDIKTEASNAIASVEKKSEKLNLIVQETNSIVRDSINNISKNHQEIKQLFIDSLIDLGINIIDHLNVLESQSFTFRKEYNMHLNNNQHELLLEVNKSKEYIVTYFLNTLSKTESTIFEVNKTVEIASQKQSHDIVNIQKKLDANKDIIMNSAIDNTKTLKNELIINRQEQSANSAEINNLINITKSSILEVKTTLQESLHKLEIEQNDLYKNFKFIEIEIKKINNSIPITHQSLIKLINKNTIKIENDLEQSIQDINQIDKQITELAQGFKKLIYETTHNIENHSHDIGNNFTELESKLKTLQENNQKNYYSIQDILHENYDSITKYNENKKNQLESLIKKLSDLTSTITIAKNPEMNITHSAKNDIDSDTISKYSSDNIKKRLSQEIPKWDKKDPNRVETIKDDNTGKTVKNTYQNNNLIMSEMIENNRVTYIIEFDTNGHKTKSKNYNNEGHPVIELEFHPNGQIAQRKETILKNGKHFYKITKFDLQGNII
ncbi:hypothetical protein [Pectinatus sottacetonis]|uniref:hypothetical protein n=1 Tax=Pectinatus sottacetonis TaxID=1002795 RepID=UPI0018C64B9A|nr:hypothetical protein [Pectinatus sottacetonis]